MKTFNKAGPVGAVLALLAACGGGGDTPTTNTTIAGAPMAAAPTVSTSVATALPVATVLPIATPTPVSPPTLNTLPAILPPVTPLISTTRPVAVTVAANCAGFANGIYQLASPTALNDAQLASTVTFDAATMRTKAANGTETQWTADLQPCSFSAPGAALRVSKSGLAILRTEDNNGKAGLSLMFPAQSFALTELAGYLNLLTFDQETGGVNYSTYSGFYELNATGQFTNFEVCQFSSTCNTTPFRPSPIANLAGGFDYKDVNGESIRAFGFKSADGSIIFIAVRANAGGITIAAPRKALNPVSANINDYFIEVSSNGTVSAIGSREFIRSANTQTNVPFDGNVIVGNAEIMISLPGMGVSAWTVPGTRSFGFSVDK